MVYTPPPVLLLCLQAEAGRSAAPVGPSAPLLEAAPQQPPEGVGQCSQLGLGQHRSHPLPAAPLVHPSPRHCAGDAGLKVRTDTHVTSSILNDLILKTTGNDSDDVLLY